MLKRLFKTMLKFYFNGSPNPTKVALFLEETGLPFEPHPIDIRKGEQFAPDFLALNPNAKIPVIVDDETVVFDSSAILLYLAEKTGQFLPDAKYRGELLSWMMFTASGVGPFSGQSVHFTHFASEKVPYAIARYQFEARRHFGILNDRLATHEYMVGDAYSIVDMNIWAWIMRLPFVLGQDADEAWSAFPHLKRLNDFIEARPAAERAKTLKDRFTFKTDLDAEARQHMFRHAV
jgi:GSH-dependent disulfide-bond oxidoreductase